MILYNVTVNIDANTHLEWLDWMRSQHIPEVMNTKCFIESRISRVHGEEEGGFTFAVTYLCPTQELMDLYEEKFAPKLQADHTSRYQGKFVVFRTMLSVIEEFKA
jgi:hypothetical protein